MKRILIAFVLLGFLPLGGICFDLFLEIHVLVGLDKPGNGEIEILHRSHDNSSDIDRNPIDDQNTYLVCKIVSEWEVEGKTKYFKFKNLRLAENDGHFIFKKGGDIQKVSVDGLRQMSSRQIYSLYRKCYPEDLPYPEN
jgi:hypothetical protein